MNYFFYLRKNFKLKCMKIVLATSVIFCSLIFTSCSENQKDTKEKTKIACTCEDCANGCDKDCDANCGGE